MAFIDYSCLSRFVLFEIVLSLTLNYNSIFIMFLYYPMIFKWLKLHRKLEEDHNRSLNLRFADINMVVIALRWSCCNVNCTLVLCKLHSDAPKQIIPGFRDNQSRLPKGGALELRILILRYRIFLTLMNYAISSKIINATYHRG